MYRGLVVLIAALAGCRFAPLGPEDHGGPEDSKDDGPGAGSDAPVIDDAPKAPCPPTYDAAHHRLEPRILSWLEAEKTCETDAPGSSHLVVLSDDAERIAVAALAQALPGDAWVGIVRDPGGTAPWAWRYVTGGPATYAPWEGSEPNNMSGDQYIAVLRRTSSFLYDYNVTLTEASVCECDGQPAVNADYDPATTN